MIWKLEYTNRAKQDLINIHEYIKNELHARELARKIVSNIMGDIQGLSEMPMRHRRYEEEPWFGYGMRFFPSNKYLIFYIPCESENTVYIARVLYKGRDISKQLNK